MISISVLVFLLLTSFWSERRVNATPLPTGIDITVAESLGFTEALKSAKPGDRLFLPKGVYYGSFIARNNGTEEHPIEIASKTGGMNALILGNRKAPAIIIQGNHWKLYNIRILNEDDIGLLVRGNHFYGEGLTIDKASTGVILKGKQNKLVNSTITDAGTGVEIDGANDVELSGNKVLKSKNCILGAEASKYFSSLKGNQCNPNV